MTTVELDRDRLADALCEADLRVAVMCLVHLTGDLSWLAEPYRPRRDVSLIADEQAGFDDATAHEIRAALADAVAGGAEPAIGDPGDELMLRMMCWCMNEDIDPAYAPMMREDLGFTSRDPEWRAGTAPPDDALGERHVIVVGAGASGIGLGARLLRLGIPFTIVERADDVGGTWRDNTYPGCGVDTPNHAYSFSMGSRYPWSRNFSPQPELLDYLRGCADEFGVRDHVRFEHRVTGARWDESTHRWIVTADTPDGRATVTGTDLVVAIGQFGIPSVPAIDGMDDFDGPMFHTTAWPDDLDVTGKRVAIIGTGASAMQIVPSIAADVDRLTVFQRSAQWARPIPRYHDPIGDGAQWLLANVPFYAPWFRFTMLWRYGDGLLPFLRKDPDWEHPERSLNRINEKHRHRDGRAHIESELGDRTRPRSRRAHPPTRRTASGSCSTTVGTARLLRDERRVGGRRRSSASKPEGVRYRRRSHCTSADVIVLSTGFRHDRDGARGPIRWGATASRLDDVWGDDDATAHLGITIPGFPNLFLMQGPVAPGSGTAAARSSRPRVRPGSSPTRSCG